MFKTRKPGRNLKPQRRKTPGAQRTSPVAPFTPLLHMNYNRFSPCGSGQCICIYTYRISTTEPKPNKTFKPICIHMRPYAYLRIILDTHAHIISYHYQSFQSGAQWPEKPEQLRIGVKLAKAQEALRGCWCFVSCKPE